MRSRLGGEDPLGRGTAAAECGPLALGPQVSAGAHVVVILGGGTPDGKGRRAWHAQRVVCDEVGGAFGVHRHRPHVVPQAQGRAAVRLKMVELVPKAIVSNNGRPKVPGNCPGGLEREGSGVREEVCQQQGGHGRPQRVPGDEQLSRLASQLPGRLSQALHHADAQRLVRLVEAGSASANLAPSQDAWHKVHFQVRIQLLEHQEVRSLKGNNHHGGPVWLCGWVAVGHPRPGVGPHSAVVVLSHEMPLPALRVQRRNP
mmetsp:Transcript_40774/g.115335  ORF Transcript_40774/g.115335 Transcript_40774/m.115335 type:complete len:258 (+) Transcript_40774:1053-1826(+)